MKSIYHRHAPLATLLAMASVAPLPRQSTSQLDGGARITNQQHGWEVQRAFRGRKAR